MSSVNLTKIASTSGCYIYTESWSDIDRTTESQLAPQVLFKFSVPTSVQMGTIKKVTLTYEIYNPAYNYIYINTTRIRPVFWDETYANSISSGNYNGYVSGGSGITFVDKFYPPENISITKDITSIFANNIDNNSFSFDIDFEMSSNSSALMSLPLESRFLYVRTAPTITVVYDELTVSAPTLYEPCDSYINRSDNITFKWGFTSDGNTVQSIAYVEYKAITATDYTVVTLSGSTDQYTINSYTLVAGSYMWRVKTVDSNGNSSSYSTSQFVVIEPPSLAVVTSVTNGCLPVIKWNSVNQASYEARLTKENEVLDHVISGGSEKTYKCNKFLENGTYSFSINIRNNYNLWSGWSEKIFTINVAYGNIPSKPIVQASTDGYKVRLMVDSSCANNYLYRIDHSGNVVCLGNIGTGIYIDNTAILNQESQYYVRAYNGTGYKDSDIVKCYPKCDGFVLSNSIYTINITQSIENYMSFSETRTNDKRLMHYLGRSKAVIERSEFATNVITRTFFIRENELSILKNIDDSLEIPCYRDNRSRKMFCSIESINAVNQLCDKGYNISLKLTEVDYEEGVDIIA